MLKIFPAPYETEGRDFSWNQLTLGVNDLQSCQEIVTDFWQLIVPALNKLRSVRVKGPEDEAWFHLRSTSRQNTEKSSLEYAGARIEILSLKRGSIQQEDQEKIRLYTDKYSDVVSAGWWPLNFAGRHDNAFLSFLQKLSVLHVQDQIFYKKYLGKIVADYEKCPYCQEPYKVMMNPNSPWSKALKPWFKHMSSTNMEPNRTHEYALWFGQFLRDGMCHSVMKVF